MPRYEWKSFERSVEEKIQTIETTNPINIQAHA